MPIQYHDALSRLLAGVSRLPAEDCPCDESLGRILAADVRSPIALPPFDQAAMDGYALRAPQPPVPGSEHAVSGEQAAGDAALHDGPGACAIMTGARIPVGLDTVVALECTRALDASDDGVARRIRLLDAVAPGQNIRRAGEDAAAGEVLLTSGTRLEPSHRMLLAAAGVPDVPVVRRPRCVVIATGRELVADPRQPLGDGHIYGSNSPYLAAALARAGAEVLACLQVDDVEHACLQALRDAAAMGVDIVISTGAVSMGRYDVVPDALRRAGAELLFHKVAIRPGKPLLAARLPQGPLVLALPGTPMAAAAGLRFFVAPVLRSLQGRPAEPVLRALLDTPQRPRPGLRHFLRGSFHLDTDGRLRARVLPLQQPFRMRPFAAADGWVVLDEHRSEYQAGAMVEILPLHPEGGYRIRPDDGAEGAGA